MQEDRLERRYTLTDAASTFFPNSRLTKRTLQRLGRMGRLRVERIAGVDFVTESAVREMCAAAGRGGQTGDP
jgi:hypothetical protein